MVISVQFKDKNKNFRGKSYDYLLHKEEKIPCRGEIVRLMDEDYEYKHYGTRVMVTKVRMAATEDRDKLDVVRYISTTLD